MIPAAFLAGCPSAIDRVRWFVLSHGGIDLLPWPLPIPGALMIGLPAIVVSVLALWTWYARRVNFAAALFIFAAAVHPPLTLALIPLFAWVAGAAPRRGTSLVRLAVVMAATGAVLWWATPSCDAPARASVLALLTASLPIASSGVGAIVAVLAVFETLRNPRSPLTAVTWLVVLASEVALWVFQSFHAVATLAPACVLLWWLAAHGAVALVRRQPTIVTRLGALALIVLVPVLQLVAVARSLPPQPTSAPHSPRAIVGALDAMWWPAAVVAEDSDHTLLTTIWSAGEQRGSRLHVLDAADDRSGDESPTRAIYAFERGAQRLAQSGMWMAPVEPAPPATTPILWRAFGSRACVPLTPEWQEVTSLAADGQISALFARGGTRRHAIVYAVVATDAAISPVGWPRDTLLGYKAMVFDASKQLDREAAVQTMQADGFSLAMIPQGARFLARLSIERFERTPGALAIAFAANPEKLFARLDTEPLTHPLELCRSSQDLTVVGHREAPHRTTLDVSSPAVTGLGWHSSEGEGDTAFRWTSAPVSELRFIAIQPAPLTLSFPGLHMAVPDARDKLTVSLNGVAATCESSDGECAWVLPLEAMRPGLNVVTLDAPLVQGITSDARPLGLRVGRAELHHRGATGRDFAVPRR